MQHPLVFQKSQRLSLSSNDSRATHHRSYEQSRTPSQIRVQLERALRESLERETREREVAKNACRDVAVAELQLRLLPSLQAQIEALTVKLDTACEA
jgi:hypothetical protein